MNKISASVLIVILSSVFIFGEAFGAKNHITLRQNYTFRSDRSNQQTTFLNNELDETIFEESFDDGIPDDWSIVDHAGNGGVWTFLAEDEYLPYGIDAPYPIEESTPLVFIDSDAMGDVEVETSLITPYLDVSGHMEFVLEFDHFLRNYDDSGTRIWVEITTDGGNNWTIVEYWRLTVGDDDPENGFIQDYPALFELDGYIGNADSISIRFRYRAEFQYFWAVDNVKISGERIPAPSELELVHIGIRDINLTWRPCEDSLDGFIRYNIYRNELLLETTQDTAYTHRIPTLGTWTFFVTALWDVGE